MSFCYHAATGTPAGKIANGDSREKFSELEPQAQLKDVLGGSRRLAERKAGHTVTIDSKQLEGEPMTSADAHEVVDSPSRAVFIARINGFASIEVARAKPFVAQRKPVTASEGSGEQ